MDDEPIRIFKFKISELRDATTNEKEKFIAKVTYIHTLKQKMLSLFRQKRFDDALYYANQILELDPTNNYALEAKVEILRSRGEYDEALRSVDEALRLKPDEPYFWVFKERIMAFAEGPSEGLNYVEKALQLNPNHPAALLDKLILLDALGRQNEALDVADILIHMNHKNYDVWGLKGRILAHLGNTKEALKCFNTALKLKPNHFHIIYEKSKLLKKLGKYKEALEGYKLLIRLDPKNAEACLKVANLYYNIKKYQDALEYYHQAIRIKVEEKVTARRLSLFNLEPDTKWLTPKEEAIKEYYFTQLGLTSQMFSLDFTGESIKYVMALKKVRDKNWRDWYMHGLALYELGSYYEASNCFKRAIAKKSKLIDAWVGLTMALFMNQDFEEATKVFNNTLKLDSSVKERYKDNFLAVLKLVDVYEKIYATRHEA